MVAARKASASSAERRSGTYSTWLSFQREVQPMGPGRRGVGRERERAGEVAESAAPERERAGLAAESAAPEQERAGEAAESAAPERGRRRPDMGRITANRSVPAHTVAADCFALYGLSRLAPSRDRPYSMQIGRVQCERPKKNYFLTFKLLSVPLADPGAGRGHLHGKSADSRSMIFWHGISAAGCSPEETMQKLREAFQGASAREELETGPSRSSQARRCFGGRVVEAE